MIKLNDYYQQKKETAEATRKNVSIAQIPTRLDTDLLSGLRMAVSNAQMRLALEYIYEIIDAQAAQITELQDNINSLQLGPAEEVKPAEPKKAPKKAAVDVPTEENV